MALHIWPFVQKAPNIAHSTATKTHIRAGSWYQSAIRTLEDPFGVTQLHQRAYFNLIIRKSVIIHDNNFWIDRSVESSWERQFHRTHSPKLSDAHERLSRLITLATCRDSKVRWGHSIATISTMLSFTFFDVRVFKYNDWTLSSKLQSDGLQTIFPQHADRQRVPPDRLMKT